LVNAQPYQGKKKGSDGGIDGLLFFQDDEKGAKKIIVSVKGGEHVSVTMLKDLIATVEREKAAIGLFVTLAEPTKPMITEAVSAGFYKSPKGDVPKIQILTIDGLISGKERAQYFDMSSGVYNFKKAKVEKRKAEQNKLDGF
jgi:site-specific DNA-methyltransferase (adenine-specific)